MNKAKGGGKHCSPNDMRSMTKNPNNPAFKAAAANHAMQLNPETREYSSSRKVSEEEEGDWSDDLGRDDEETDE